MNVVEEMTINSAKRTAAGIEALSNMLSDVSDWETKDNLSYCIYKLAGILRLEVEDMEGYIEERDRKIYEEKEEKVEKGEELPFSI